MKNRKITVGIILAAAVGAALIVSQLRQSADPTYSGRSLRSWLTEFSGGYESADPEAVAAIRTIGTNGLPVLLAELKYREPPWRKNIRRVFDNLRIARLTLEPPWNRNLQAAYAFHVLGADGRSAIPDLADLISRSQSALPAAIAMAGIGEGGLPELATALVHTNARVRMYVASGLGHWRGSGSEVVPILLKALPDADAMVRSSVALTLGQLRLNPGIAVPALISALNDAQPRVRNSAAFALGMFGGDAESSLSALRKLKADTDPDVTSTADWAVNKIQEELKKR
jgi:hypothetical protein